MKKSLFVSIIISFLIVGVGLAVMKDTGYYKPSVPTWLTGSTEEKVNELGLVQPSYADLMLWTGIRLNELFAAGVTGKTQYAKLQARKIEETLEKAAVVDPRRRSGIEGLLSANYPGLIEAIDSNKTDVFQAAFGKLYASCVNCHVKNGVHFYPLIPTTSISPITAGSIQSWEEIQKHLREEQEKK
ncbi:MAG TPA: hypothetical protein VGA95_13165 [Thermodesulfobacteriota bacterium]|jgi:hypothetical protein